MGQKKVFEEEHRLLALISRVSDGLSRLQIERKECKKNGVESIPAPDSELLQEASRALSELRLYLYRFYSDGDLHKSPLEDCRRALDGAACNLNTSSGITPNRRLTVRAGAIQSLDPLLVSKGFKSQVKKFLKLIEDELTIRYTRDERYTMPGTKYVFSPSDLVLTSLQ
jgi:hypothetical protein